MPLSDYKKKDDKKKKPKFKIVPRKKKEEKKEEPKKKMAEPSKKKPKFKIVPRKKKEEEKKPEKKKPEQPKRKAPERKKPEKPTRAPPERKGRGKAPQGAPPAQRNKWFLKHGGSSQTKGKTDLISYSRGKPPTPQEIARGTDSREEYDYVEGRLSSMYGNLGKKYSSDQFYGRREAKPSGNFKMLDEVSLSRYAGGSKRTNGGSKVYIDNKTGAVYDNEKDWNEGDITGKVITISRGRGKRQMKGIEIMYEDARNDIFGKNFGVLYGFDYGYVGEQGRLEDVLKGLKKSKDGFDFIPKLNLDLLD